MCLFLDDLYFDYFSCTKFTDSFIQLLEDLKCEYSITKTHGNSVLTILNHDLIPEVFKKVFIHGISVNATRIDVCFDFLIPFSSVELPKDFSNIISDRNNEYSTIYVGSRRSDRFCRIYDKKKESNLDYDCTRYEFEFKGELCNELGYRLQFFGFEDMKNRILSLITNFCVNHGISLDVPHAAPYMNYHLISHKDKLDRDMNFLIKYGKRFLDLIGEYNLTKIDIECIVEGDLNLNEL